MAEITGQRTYTPESVPQVDPWSEQRSMLEHRLSEARERIMRAEQDLSMWRPIAASSESGLMTLDKAMSEEQQVLGARDAESIVKAAPGY